MKSNNKVSGKELSAKAVKDSIKNYMCWIIQPISWALLLFGFQKVEQLPQRIFPVGKQIKTYSVLFYIMLALVEVFLIYMMYFNEINKENIARDSLNILIIIPTYLSVFITVMTSIHFAPHLIVKFINNMDIIDEYLNIDRKSLYSPFRRNIIILEVSYIIFLLARLAHNCLLWSISPIMVFWCINEVILHLTMMEFIAYLAVVKAELSTLNVQLQRMSKMRNKRDSDAFCTYTLRIRDVMMEKYTLSKMDRDLKTLSLMSEEKNRNSQIVQLLKVYDKIADNVEILNLCYGAPLLFISGATFVNILSIIKDGIMYSTRLQEFWATSNTLVWCISSLWWTMFSAFKCATLSQNGAETLDIVNKMTVQPNLEAVEQKILERFSLSVSSRQLNISACNFFPYNLTFIQSLVGAMVSYGIIVGQS